MNAIQPLDLELPSNHLLVVARTGTGAQAAILSPQDDPVACLAQMGLQRAHLLEIRLFGRADRIAKTRQALHAQSYPVGRCVHLEGQRSHLLRFEPSTGKVKIPVGSRGPIRVLVVDDSATIRKLLTQIISADPQLLCIADIGDPWQAEEAIATLCPDVITLDIQMPGLNGVELLKRIVPKYRIPCVMISALSKEDGPYVLDALESGAVDYIQKPSFEKFSSLAPAIQERIRTAAKAQVQLSSSHAGSALSALRSAQPVAIDESSLDLSSLIALGASTGGTEALKEVLTQFPSHCPPILIVQHIPPVFSKAFADRLNSLCPFTVKEASDGDLVTPGLCLIAPGGYQMRVKKEGTELRLVVDDSPPINLFKPSVDALFHSIAEARWPKVVAALLTGMGADGAQGLLALRRQGAHTIAQDESTSVVYGMPRVAAEIGAAEKILPLHQIAPAVLEWCAWGKTKRPAA